MDMNKFVAIGAVAVGIGGAVLWMTMRGDEAVRDAGVTQISTGTEMETVAGAPDAPDTSGIVEMTLGPEDAKVTIVEYASFTCPYCARFHKDQFKQLKADYIDTGKVRFVYRDVFFDQLGLWASMVARCAGPEKFFGISDMIYNQQSDWIAGGDPVQASDNLRRIGKVAGLDKAQLDTCLEDEDKARALVTWFRANAEADDVSATPTLLINGRKYSNMSYADLKGLVDEKLAE